MFLLDTNVFSEFRRAKPHGGVVTWIRSLQHETLHIAAISFGEIQMGIERTRPRDPAKAIEIEAWLDHIASVYNVLSMDGEVFCIWARLIEGKLNPDYADGMIAATALRYGLTIATRNVRDFADFPVSVVNPFTTLN